MDKPPGDSRPVLRFGRVGRHGPHPTHPSRQFITTWFPFKVGHLRNGGGELQGKCPTISRETYRLVKYYLAGGLKYFLCPSLPGEMIQFDSYFLDGFKPPTSYHLARNPLLFSGDLNWEPHKITRMR